jgi:NAD(P)-dependent dehydrogenase (short-subunit alcohol dehydrogenase family)
VQLTRYFAQYFKGDSIRVNSLSPGGIFHNQPSSFLEAYSKHCGKKGMLDPQDIIGALLFLLSNGSRYMTGQNLIIDDGFSL